MHFSKVGLRIENKCKRKIFNKTILCCGMRTRLRKMDNQLKSNLKGWRRKAVSVWNQNVLIQVLKVTGAFFIASETSCLKWPLASLAKPAVMEAEGEQSGEDEVLDSDPSRTPCRGSLRTGQSRGQMKGTEGGYCSHGWQYLERACCTGQH